MAFPDNISKISGQKKQLFLTPVEASKKLENLVSDFIESISHRTVRMRAFEKELLNHKEKLLLNLENPNDISWFASSKIAFEKLLDLHADDFSFLGTTIKASAGLGKTHAVIKMLKYFNGVVWFIVPNNKIAEEIKDKFISEGFNSVHRYEGRNNDNCKRYNFIRKLAENEHIISKSICKDGDNECPAYNECPYIHRLDNLKNLKVFNNHPTIIIMAHACLAVTLQIPKPNLVVVDESHWAAMIEVTPIKIPQLLKLAQHKSVGSAQYSKIINIILEALSKNPRNYLKYLRENNIRNEADLQPAIDYINGLKQDIAPISPQLNDVVIKKHLDNYEVKPRILHKALMLLELLGKELAITSRDEGHILRYNETKREIIIHGKKELNPAITKAVPVLILDASANSKINAIIWGKNLNKNHISVQRKVVVHQVLNKGFSKQSIIGKDANGKDFRSDVASKLRYGLAGFINSCTADGKVFVAGSKKVIEILRPLLKEEVLTGHFSTLRGINKFEHCDIAVIIGREQPSPLAIEASARALCSLSPQPLNLTGEYFKKSIPISFNNGAKEDTLTFDAHADNFVQSVVEQIRENESEQSLDRLRLIHATKAKVVYNLSSILIPSLPIDYAHSWKELILGGSRIERALYALYNMSPDFPVFPLGQTELARLFPHLWKSPDAVKADIVRDGGIKWVETQIRNNYLQNNPFIRVEYRRHGQRGKASPAIMSANIIDIKKYLEKIIGAGTVESSRIVEDSLGKKYE